jgi:glucose-6-phosphate 1-epimerase
MNIEQLDKDYAIPGQLTFIEGKGGLPMIQINSDKASALISMYAGQVLSYRPAGEPADLMFLSEKAYYQADKAIKGGAPICWPWFGPDPAASGRAAHGFVRNRLWQIVDTEITTDGDVMVTLGLEDSAETKNIWPHAFTLTQQITVGKSLNLELITKNTGTAAFSITQAFHTYFNIGDINQTRVLGLEACQYIDKVDNSAEKQQTGAISVNAEVDRIYLAVKNEQVIEDAALERRIRITSSGNTTAVVWNPWEKIAAEMADLQDSDYRRFICVETANAAEDVIEVKPNSNCRLAANYCIERD